MERINKDIVIIGLDVETWDIVENLKRRESTTDTLIITNEITKKIYESGQQIQSSLYVLKILTNKGKVIGIIAVDKLVGELILINTKSLYFSRTSLEINFKEIEGISNLFAHPYKLLQDTEIEITTKDSCIEIQPNLEGLYTLQDEIQVPVNSQDETASDEEILKEIKILPDLDKLNLLQEQIKEIITNHISVNQSDSDLKKAKHLLHIIEDGVQRHAIEEYNEKANIYELIKTQEVIGDVRLGLRLVESKISELS